MEVIGTLMAPSASLFRARWTPIELQEWFQSTTCSDISKSQLSGHSSFVIQSSRSGEDTDKTEIKRQNVLLDGEPQVLVGLKTLDKFLLTL